MKWLNVRHTANKLKNSNIIRQESYVKNPSKFLKCHIKRKRSINNSDQH